MAAGNVGKAHTPKVAGLFAVNKAPISIHPTFSSWDLSSVRLDFRHTPLRLACIKMRIEAWATFEIAQSRFGGARRGRFGEAPSPTPFSRLRLTPRRVRAPSHGPPWAAWAKTSRTNHPVCGDRWQTQLVRRSAGAP